MPNPGPPISYFNNWVGVDNWPEEPIYESSINPPEHSSPAKFGTSVTAIEVTTRAEPLLTEWVKPMALKGKVGPCKIVEPIYYTVLYLRTTVSSMYVRPFYHILGSNSIYPFT